MQNDFITPEGLELLQSGQTVHIVPPDGTDQEDHEDSTMCWCETVIHMTVHGGIICEHLDYGERLARFEDRKRNLSVA